LGSTPFCLLTGFGATAINPYLALSTIETLKNNGSLETSLDLKTFQKLCKIG
jgi:glutamate synthase (NADPH/NADH) large chain